MPKDETEDKDGESPTMDKGDDTTRVGQPLAKQYEPRYAHSSVASNSTINLLCFFGPALFHRWTSVIPIFMTAILRMMGTHLFLSLHYHFVDKDNYENKITLAQIQREKKDYLVGVVLHMWAQLVLQLLFPQMFFVDDSKISSSLYLTFMTHVFLVEPLYYVVHRWLHIPKNMKAMHGFHHLSVNTVPSTSLVQNTEEHFIYIATFGPAMILPYFIAGYQHWAVIAFYLVWFDAVNAYGHTNIRCRHWLWESPWSPLRYLFYTPEFHLGHHAYYNKNYGLFMPIWDHLFSTFRDYKKPPSSLLPSDKQDFVFIGHNGGLGHFLTIPELSFYNMYDTYITTGLPLQLEFLVMHLIMKVCRLMLKFYKVSRYLAANKHVGRIICIMKSPIDYMTPSSYESINKEILTLIKDQHREHGTRYFGLGNLNKMKQLNDGGVIIADMIAKDEYLKDKKVRLWTGDTLTAASVYQEIISFPGGVDKIFYIGASGKIGHAVCKKLVQRGIKITIFSKYVSFEHPLVTYTQNIQDMLNFPVTVVGKYLKPSLYAKALGTTSLTTKDIVLLDYTVPFLPLGAHKIISKRVHHIQIGVLKVTNNDFLRGYYDVCMGLPQGQIYPCHAGCIINTVQQKESNEVGEIDVTEMDRMWAEANKAGLYNRDLVLTSRN